ncbi:nitrous oxide reductase family maturation protein NosD [Chitinophaga sp. 212800010-3]|uniref:nitrous oxide reductase family maturation protein NosD n=1 Tax=unclassified Chitinophaga TaxID=2619133 RepID=UPI002DE7BBAD|nr:Nitrous oxide reductase family maturation protein NosD [Chitinophaga sp. 212800010-3]
MGRPASIKPLKYLLCLLWLMSGNRHSLAATIHIYPGPGAIHNAIKKAKPGDTLLLNNGRYNENNIEVPLRITIRGVGKPVVDAAGQYPGFIIRADSVVVENIQVQHTGRSSIADIAAIRIVDAKNVTVSNNRIYESTYGVYLQNAHSCVVQGNLIHTAMKDEINGGNGIHAWKCSGLRISRNNISGHRDGIYFEFVTDSNIDGNLSYDNQRYGLHFMFSHRDSYTGNTFRQNGAGVAVMYSKNVTMYGNTFIQNWGDASYGLLLKEISDSRIEHNQFLKNTIGIYLESTTRVDVLRNLFQDNGWALRVMASSSGSRFDENNFIGNSFDVATNGTLVMNTFSHNYWDKYDGYDLNRDHIGDVPHYPVSVYAIVSEKIPPAMILYHSLLTSVMDQVEKVMPSVIPDQLKDDYPMMKKLQL